MAKFEWKGDDLKAKMKAATVQSVKETAKRVAEGGQARCRKDTHALEKSIKVQGEPTANGSVISVDVGSDDPKVPYAAKQELGPADPEEKYGFTPWLRPSFEENRGTLVKLIADKIGK